MQSSEQIVGPYALKSTPLHHGANAASVEVDAVVHVLDRGKRKEMVQAVFGISVCQPDLAVFDAIDDADVLAIIAHDFHMLLDLIGSDHRDLLVFP